MVVQKNQIWSHSSLWTLFLTAQLYSGLDDIYTLWFWSKRKEEQEISWRERERERENRFCKMVFRRERESCLKCVFKNWKLLFKNIYKNTYEWKNVLKYVNYCLKTKNNYLKTQTNRPTSCFLFFKGSIESVDTSFFKATVRSDAQMPNS